MTPKQHAFLAAYARSGNVTAACEASDTGRRSHYDWLAEPEYKAAFETAREEAIERLEAEARRRAEIGHAEPVIWHGELMFAPARDKQTGEVLRNDDGAILMTDEPLTIRKPSDVLLMFLLKSLRPDKYRDNVKLEHSGDLTVITERLQAGRRRLQEAA